MNNPYKISPLQWIVSNDTGVSSVLIWSIMVGVKPQQNYCSIPCDSHDFGRCYRLLKHVPEWLPRLPEVAEKYPAWKPLVREWELLTFLYETKQTEELNKLLKALRVEASTQ